MEKSASKKRILIVEDDVENQKYFELILKCEYDVDLCDNKASMYSYLNTRNYNAIIMDISLKNGNNGLELIKELKTKSSNGHIPIICLSAFTYNDERLKAKAAGADIYLTKPVKGNLLLSTLAELTRVNNKLFS